MLVPFLMHDARHKGVAFHVAEIGCVDQAVACKLVFGRSGPVGRGLVVDFP